MSALFGKNGSVTENEPECTKLEVGRLALSLFCLKWTTKEALEAVNPPGTSPWSHGPRGAVHSACAEGAVDNEINSISPK